MPKLVEFDLAEAFAPRVPVWLTQIVIGLLCTIVMAVLRVTLDLFGATVVPFALIYPGMMLATLAGRWLGGMVASVLLILGAWYYMLPVRNSFEFGIPSGPATIFVVSFAALLTVSIAELFRRAVRNATAERDRQIAERDLFLAEFDHRVKNNFAIVTSLLELQRRQSDPTTAAALATALARIDSIARAHRHLYRGGDKPGAVQIRDYLTELCAALADVVAMRGGIALNCTSDDALLPRDRAVSIGLIVNELVTNAAKHAFPNRASGRIDVAFARHEDGWRLSVADDGVGIDGDRRAASSDGGLGSRLVDAFARQANGAISVDSDPTGTVVTLTLVG